VGLVPTGLTSELGLGEPVLLSDVPTNGAPLRGVAGVHSDDLATSVFRFVRDAPQELSPPGVGDGTVEARFGGRPVGFVGAVIALPGLGASHHVRDLEVLVDDEVIGVDELPRQLVGEVIALVADLAVGGGHRVDCPLSLLRSLALRGQVALGRGEAGPGPVSVAPFEDEPAVTGGDPDAHSEIDADLLPGTRQWPPGDIGTPHRQPPAASFSGHGDGLGTALNISVETDLDRSDPDQAESGAFGVKTPSDGVLPLHRVEASP
jgi:hypothetical protein